MLFRSEGVKDVEVLTISDLTSNTSKVTTSSQEEEMATTTKVVVKNERSVRITVVEMAGRKSSTTRIISSSNKCNRPPAMKRVSRSLSLRGREEALGIRAARAATGKRLLEAINTSSKKKRRGSMLLSPLKSCSNRKNFSLSRQLQRSNLKTLSLSLRVTLNDE